MQFAKRLLMGIGTVALMGFLGIAIAPKSAHGLVAALVQVSNTSANPVPTAPAVPGSPFFGSMSISGFVSQSVGPGTGTLGVTQIVVTNFDSVVNQVNIYSPLLTSGTCGGNGNAEAAVASLFLVVKVQPTSTLVIPAPSPLVVGPQTGFDGVAHTCLAAGMPITGGNVFVSVSGFTN
jgi:hypothetical protein